VLPDGRVWINSDRNIVGAVRAKYDALMCRPGLPRSTVLTLDHGSRQLFRRGGIYRNGQVDLTVWLKGAIHTEYLGAGGAGGRLGLPVSDLVLMPRTTTAASCSGCRRIVLEGGRIYFKPEVGAHALWGSVLSAYLDEGGPQGALGYPTTRMHVVDGVRTASFEHGSISCTNGSCVVSVG
jgi:hypothetical protein